MSKKEKNLKFSERVKKLSSYSYSFLLAYSIIASLLNLMIGVLYTYNSGMINLAYKLDSFFWFGIILLGFWMGVCIIYLIMRTILKKSKKIENENK